MTHTKTVLASFKAGNTHTVAELNEMLNFQLNHPLTVIHQLRKQGYDIQGEWCNSGSKRFKKYKLMEVV
jgi:hypothetical protein